MTWKLAVLFVALTAGMAEGQNPYTTKNATVGPADLTTQTATLNVWKQFPSGACASQSLVDSVAGPYCVGGAGYIYRFNMATKGWDKQTSMGAIFALSIAVVAPNNVYALQSSSQCAQPDLELLNWNGSTWTQKNKCFRQISADVTGFVSGLQNNGQLYTSPDGNTWTLQTGNWFYVALGDSSQTGCAIGSDHSVWTFFPPDYTTPLKMAALPSGTAAGCDYASSPGILLSWTTTGTVYAMPVENYGTWQAVTGLPVSTITGRYRSGILALNSSGTPFHWNVNAPTVSAIYGGQWNVNNGCPAPGSICNPSTTHTITHQVRFKSGHGLGGQKNSSTQVFTNDIEVSSSDTNPGCDPLFGVPTDVECYVVMSGGAECNQANASIADEGLNWVVADSVDVVNWAGNASSNGPMGVATSPYSGYYIGEVFNNIRDGCAVNDPVPACPAASPLQIWNRVDWEGQPTIQAPAAAARWQQLQTESILGYDSPYVVHGFYIGQADANGNLIQGTQQCFGGWLGNKDFLWGNIDAAPACH